MSDHNQKHLLLAYALQVGLTQRDLVSYGPKVLEISLEEWVVPSSIKEERKENIRANIANISIQIVEDAIAKWCIILLREDDDYPQSLTSLSHPPELLWARGNTDLLNTPSIAIVGSRKPTQYTQRSLDTIIPRLVEAGYTIISWGALGADTMAHEVALKYDGHTIAVFGTGIDRSYPASNRALFTRMIENESLIISQFPLGTQWIAYNFPIRNEIVAGLSLGLLVTEAAEESGSLITANLALESNKEVFALPGFIDHSGSSGANRLIQKWHAKLVVNADDILVEIERDRGSAASSINTKTSSNKKISSVQSKRDHLSDIHKSIYDAISAWAVHIDTISRETNIDISSLFAYIAELEIAGIITQWPWWYVLS